MAFCFCGNRPLGSAAAKIVGQIVGFGWPLPAVPHTSRTGGVRHHRETARRGGSPPWRPRESLTPESVLNPLFPVPLGNLFCIVTAERSARARVQQRQGRGQSVERVPSGGARKQGQAAAASSGWGNRARQVGADCEVQCTILPTWPPFPTPRRWSPNCESCQKGRQ